MGEPAARVMISQLAFPGRLFSVTVDQIELANGVRAQREVVHHPGAVCMVPVDANARLLLVRQYRHPAGRRLLELPAGTLEPGEDPLTTVDRELREEVGMAAESIEPLGSFYVAPGYSTEVIQLYACTGLRASRLSGDEDEDIEVEQFTAEEALAAIDAGEICDAKSIIGILLWHRRQDLTPPKLL